MIHGHNQVGIVDLFKIQDVKIVRAVHKKCTMDELELQEISLNEESHPLSRYNDFGSSQLG